MMIETAILLGSALGAASPGSLPLPLKRDIPANFSTVICGDERAARVFISDFIAPNQTGTDVNIDRFFEGLSATGCRQESGPLQIQAVLVRKPVVEGQAQRHILYRAKKPSGETVFGVVDELANNTHPRTPFEEWLSLQTQDGMLTANESDRRTYLCRSPQAARAAIVALSRAKQARLRGHRLRMAKADALRTSSCFPTQGRFRVRAIHGSVANFFGNDAESLEDWTAVTAVNGRGQVIGLLHNASLM